MNSPIRVARLLTLCMAVLTWAMPAIADDNLYRFEMVIFERPDSHTGEAWPDESGQAEDAARPVSSLDAFAVGGRKLGPVAYTLKRQGMIVHEHLAWQQSPRGRDSNAWYAVGSGRLQGQVRITRGRFLHLDADLLLRDAATARPYRAKLYRRMRSDELHYLDDPKIGIIIRADRVEAPQAADDASSGEPKPVEPAGEPGKAG